MFLLPVCIVITASLIGTVLGPGTAHAATGPVPPCTSLDAETEPAYGALNGPPQVAVFKEIELALPAACPGAASGRFEIAVSLAGRFENAGGVSDMARKIGAISTLAGLRYWSVTEARWRALFSDIFAVNDESPWARRPDFSALEVLGGGTLHFAQDDTRSSGLSIHALKVTRVSSQRLVIESYNVTPIRLLLLPMFEARSLRSFHFLHRERPGHWSYYGLSLVRAGGVLTHERSLVNRAAAYYRFLAGMPADGAPPLAP